MNKILLWSVTAALAGFLFGFDTVVISGADTRLQELWHTSDVFHGSGCNFPIHLFTNFVRLLREAGDDHAGIHGNDCRYCHGHGTDLPATSQ